MCRLTWDTSCVTSLCPRCCFPFPFFYWAQKWIVHPFFFPRDVWGIRVVFLKRSLEIGQLTVGVEAFCGIAEEESEFASFRDGVILLRLGDQQLPSRSLLYKHCARETMQAKPRQVCLLIKQNKMNDAASVSNMSIFLTGYSHDLTLGWNLIILCGWGRETVLALHVQLEQCRRDFSLLTLHVGEIKR